MAALVRAVMRKVAMVVARRVHTGGLGIKLIFVHYTTTRDDL